VCCRQCACAVAPLTLTLDASHLEQQRSERRAALHAPRVRHEHAQRMQRERRDQRRHAQPQAERHLRVWQRVWARVSSRVS
jgi:hypothetical protein